MAEFLVQNMRGDKCVHFEAFPIGLVMPEGQKEDPDAFMKTHLNDSNFKGEIVDIYTAFLKKIEHLQVLLQVDLHKPGNRTRG